MNFSDKVNFFPLFLYKNKHLKKCLQNLSKKEKLSVLIYVVVHLCPLMSIYVACIYSSKLVLYFFSNYFLNNIRIELRESITKIFSHLVSIKFFIKLNCSVFIINLYKRNIIHNASIKLPKNYSQYLKEISKN